MFRGSNKFLLIESFHIPDIFVARLIPIDAHICTGKRSIVVAYNTGRNDISGRNALWVVSNNIINQCSRGPSDSSRLRNNLLQPKHV